MGGFIGKGRERLEIGKLGEGNPKENQISKRGEPNCS